jgi:hypothetical protein
MHPLVTSFENLKDAEIESKIGDLTKKYFIASNPGVKAQIHAVLDEYNQELSRRRQLAWDKMMTNRDKGLDKLIKVN